MECQSRKDVIGTLRTIANIMKRMCYSHSFLFYIIIHALQKNQKIKSFSYHTQGDNRMNQAYYITYKKAGKIKLPAFRFIHHPSYQ